MLQAADLRTGILYNFSMPVETTYSNLRQNLAAVLAQSDSDNEVFVVRRRKGRDIALIPADELAAILETAHLLSSPANARRLLKALRRADAHQTPSSTIEQLRRDLGLETK
jgi:antitoxin YefM